MESVSSLLFSFQLLRQNILGRAASWAVPCLGSSGTSRNMYQAVFCHKVKLAEHCLCLDTELIAVTTSFFKGAHFSYISTFTVKVLC